MVLRARDPKRATLCIRVAETYALLLRLFHARLVSGVVREKPEALTPRTHRRAAVVIALATESDCEGGEQDQQERAPSLHKDPLQGVVRSNIVQRLSERFLVSSSGAAGPELEGSGRA